MHIQDDHNSLTFCLRAAPAHPSSTRPGMNGCCHSVEQTASEMSDDLPYTHKAGAVRLIDYACTEKHGLHSHPFGMGDPALDGEPEETERPELAMGVLTSRSWTHVAILILSGHRERYIPTWLPFPLPVSHGFHFSFLSTHGAPDSPRSISI